MLTLLAKLLTYIQRSIITIVVQRLTDQTKGLFHDISRVSANYSNLNGTFAERLSGFLIHLLFTSLFTFSKLLSTSETHSTMSTLYGKQNQFMTLAVRRT